MIKRALTWWRRQHPEIPDEVDLCSGCGNPHDRAGQRYCAACHRSHQKKYRDKRVLVAVDDLTEEQRVKLRSPRIVSRATKVSG